jgi:TRAP-type mannitol/chloroaromatic compound transport system permease large subunit
MDPMGIIVLCVPIFLPIIKILNFDPLWFGVLFNLNMLTGYLTPPFGLSLFYLKGVVPQDVSMRDIIQGTLPFVAIYLLTIALIMIFPQMAIWLPGTMTGN